MQSLQYYHSCLVCIRFVVLCETYLRRKDELTKAERKEILEYTRGRLVDLIISLQVWNVSRMFVFKSSNVSGSVSRGY